MSTLDRPARPLATGLTLVVLVAVVGGLIALVLRPGSASLWPAGERPADARGAVLLDEPPHR